MSDKQGAPTLPPLTGGGGNNGGSNGGAPQQTVSLQQVFANVLNSANVQQFVLASPGLTQVIPSSGTTSQPIGVTRIVNLSGTNPRVSVVNVTGASGSTGTGTGTALTSPSRQNTKLVLTTSPKLVRTSIANMFVTPTTQASVQSTPAKKKRLSEGGERPTSVETSDAMGYRRRIIEHKLKRMRAVRDKYNDNVSELFFLQNGGNLMDYYAWRKRPPTAQYLQFMKQQRLEQEDGELETLGQIAAPVENTAATVSTAAPTTNTASTTTAAATATTTTCTTTTVVTTTTTPVAVMTTTATTNATTTTTTQSTEVAVSGGTPVAVSTTLPPAVAQLSQQGQIPGRPQGGRHGMVFTFRAAIQASPVTAHPSPTTTIAPALIIGGKPIVIESTKSNSTPTINPVAEKALAANPVEKPATPPLTSGQPIVKLVKLPASTIASSCDNVSNQEQIVEKAKQEAYVMQRIAELQREGLWSERRLPKVQEPTRPKAHWDYLLEEMVWLSTDFAQERKWKKSAAKKCARMVQKYFQEKAIQAQKAEKLEELRLKKIAGFIAKEIKTFWANVEKLVEYKQQTRLEEKRKKALDQHLNFIVDQTEKYSSWLTEGLNKPEGTQSTPASIHSSRISSPITSGKHSDDDFKPNQDSDDDEETIAKAEEEMKSNHKEEVELLKKESELPLEDILKELPPNYLEERDKSLSPLPKEAEESDNVEEGKDTEFTVASDQSTDDEEDTIQEQEKLEKNVDHKQELDDLMAENEMSIDELRAKYANAVDTPMDVDETDEESDKEEEEEQESESENETENESEDETQDDSQTQSDEEPAVGLKSLLEDLSDENKSMNEAAEKQSEMDSVAALAESIQPKGNTLLTTSVVTKIPFLLKHNLREYQHIGLDWLVTMFERKLNGILADEMGLGKTIQTIALLAHLACEKGNWGPHLIIVPTSVMLNWEMECKKWCPGFKILTYYGTQKERKQKRTGWTKPNAFHICITSYKLVIQDHQSFRRKKWKYLILDEAQNIKNFKSQRWQLLLNFQTQRRLLLTGTPLQNNLMELWSLMHFLMPNVFQSHREFKEWFSNPVTGMIEGNNEYNENIIRRLHKVLRPFLLRRLKCEVEKQLPKKYEHVIMCRLSKRQRYLYDDFMSRAKTKETLASGNLLSVINVLMQLRKVCNHPNLFEVRPTVSPFQMEGIDFHTASLAWSALDYDPFKHIDLSCLNLLLVDLEFVMTAFVAHRVRKLKTPRKLIEEIDSQPESPPRCPSGKIKINVRLSNQVSKSTASTQQSQQQIKIKSFPGILPTPRVGTSPLVKSVNSQTPTGQGVTLKVAGGQPLQGFLQLVPHQGGVKAIPMGTVGQNISSTATVTTTTSGINTQRITVANANTKDGPQRLTTQTYAFKHGDSVQKYVPSFAQLVQTSTGRHIILTNPNQQTTNALSFPVMTSTGQRLTVLSKPVQVNKVIGNVVTSQAGGTSVTSLKPVMRVPPLNVSNLQSAGQIQPTQIRCGVVTRTIQKDTEKSQVKEVPKSEFHLPQLEKTRRQRRQDKLATLADINERRCAACPLYGEDLFTALRISKPATGCQWHSGWLHCVGKNNSTRTRRQYFSHTEALAEAIRSTEQIVEELKSVFDRFVVYVPAVRAPLPRFHVSHPPPHKLWKEQRMEMDLQRQLSPKVALFHPITSAMITQFPDPRLIQYDCGKLQSLDLLLRDLKYNGHRVLIFTQMTRMLDVLEAFLNYHGYIYLRLDGATKVDQRQVLMERFNNDKRIFCFILSTRSGGVGVNLTGADTVVFYDSDWNPTMDAQAQDRCHRIGQTRDVHIYRLISERTVEENILKKANQKRLLGDLAIEGGNFTTAYFKSSTIQDLFDVDQSETDASARMAEVLDQNKDREKHLQKETIQPEDKAMIGALESALAAVEEDQDVQAAKTAKAEAVADLAEFDENIPVEDADNDDAGVSKAEMEVQNIVSQLTPVERYAMRFVEESDGNFSAAQLAAAERELEEQKKEWERGRLRAMREEEERQMRMTDDDENPLTFTREDAQNQVNNSTSNSRRASSNKKPTRQVRRGRGRRVVVGRVSRRSNRSIEQEETSESESETTSMSETDSENDVNHVPKRGNSTDEEKNRSSKVSSSDEENDENNEDEDEDDEEENEEDEDDESTIQSGRVQTSLRNRVLSLSKKNHFDINSPRTRSSGDVKINLWTLDESPILPESKPRKRKRSKYNKSLDKSDENLTVPSLLDPDSKTRTVSESLDDISKTMDVSINSSADESICDEEDLNDTELTSTPRVKTTRRAVPKAIIRTNLRSSEKESSASSDMLQLPTVESKLMSIKATDTELKVSGLDTPSNESKTASSTPHRSPGRPRKTSQSVPVTPLTSEPHVIATYSTRSSNKLSIARPLQDKRTVPPIKINCKGDPVICDINNTSNAQNEAKEASQKSTAAVTTSTTTASPIKDASVRPNKTADSSAMSIDNEETVTTDSNEKSTDITLSEEQASSKTNTEKISLESENQSDIRSPSPILSVRKVKGRRSYSRNRTDLKDKKPSLSVTPDDLETAAIKPIDNSKNTDAPELVPTTMEVDHSPSLKATDDAVLSTNKNVTPHRSSPPLRPTKITRSAVKSITDSTENPVISKNETEAKTKDTVLVLEEKPDECKHSEKGKSSDTASSLPVATGTNTDITETSKKDKNQAHQVKGKLTRSSTRSITEVKSKEKTDGISVVTSEQAKPNAEKCRDLETTISMPMVDSKINPTQKSGGEEEQLQVPVKLTRSIARSMCESQLKVSKVSSTADIVVVDQTKTIVEKSKTEESMTIAEKEAIVEAASNQSKIPEKEKSLEAENVTTTVSKEEKDPKVIKDIVVAKTIQEQQCITSAQDSKDPALVDSPVPVSLEPKTKASKSETPVVGVTTRRSRANHNVDVASETSTVAAVSTVTNEKVILSKKADETQNKTLSVTESQMEKSTNQNADASFEQPKLTKSNMQVPNPMCRRFHSPTKVAALRRRPDTPMPTFYSIRPVTRSLSNNSNSSSSDGEGGSSSTSNQQKLSPRGSRTSLDNGFVVPSSPPLTVRRSRSTTYVKMSERLAMERNELAIRGHNIRDVASGESLTIKQVFKRRPGTPLPTPELLTRASRANMDSMYMQSPRLLPPVPKLKPIRRASALPPPPPLQPAPSRLHQQQRQQINSEMTDATDSNGNSLESEIETSSNEKPQRTAKVVAILSLESKSSSRSSSSSNNQHSLSPSQRARQLNSENSAMNHPKSPRSGRAMNVNKTSTTSSRDDNSSSQTITMIDLDDDSESEHGESVANDFQRIGKRVSRTRLSTQLCTKSSMNSFHKSSSAKEIQMIEIDDDEDDRIPLKKSRSSASTLASTGTADKLSNSNPAS
ncbi:helicase domino isoform X2 [Nasonia vitripennis]|uniref:Helicase domino n=1 Tax=Nasonia vitripennis TaxID=7425 RepID=A0A7M7Q617_NASVI|nr:helicase domino isoform X2 [Nasonia vitripennis]